MDERKYGIQILFYLVTRIIVNACLMTFKILDFFFMLFCSSQRRKTAQVTAFVSLCVFLAGIKPVFPGF